MARWAGVNLAVIIFVLEFVHFSLCEATESINMRGCGRSEHLDSIPDGSPVNTTYIPWIVQLELVVSLSHRPVRYVYCGGSIISKTVVLTAAHCFFNGEEKYKIHQVAVFYNYTDDKDTQIKLVDRVKIYPFYKRLSRGDDIALLHVREPFQLDEFVRPVCLSEDEIYLPNEQVLAAGLGIDHMKEEPPYQLMHVFLRVLSLEECSGRIDDEDLKWRVYLFICTLTPGKDVCKGASGGPLTLRRGRRWLQVGITSSGQYCNEDVEKPIMYTIVADYIDWIKHALKHRQFWRELPT